MAAVTAWQPQAQGLLQLSGVLQELQLGVNQAEVSFEQVHTELVLTGTDLGLTVHAAASMPTPIAVRLVCATTHTHTQYMHLWHANTCNACNHQFKSCINVNQSINADPETPRAVPRLS